MRRQPMYSETNWLVRKKQRNFGSLNFAAVPSSGVRVSVAQTLKRDLDKVNEWCDLWGSNLMLVRLRV